MQRRGLERNHDRARRPVPGVQRYAVRGTRYVWHARGGFAELWGPRASPRASCPALPVRTAQHARGSGTCVLTWTCVGVNAVRCRSEEASGIVAVAPPSSWSEMESRREMRCRLAESVLGTPTRSNAVHMATLEAARSSAANAAAGSPVAGPQSLGVPTARSRQARPEKMQESSWGSAEGALWPCWRAPGQPLLDEHVEAERGRA